MPEYEKITFENGFRLLLSEDSRAKSCSMGVWVGSGSCYESDDTAGISHFIEHMVFKGSALYSSEDIASISDRMGGELNAYTDKECTCFYTRVLSADAPAAFDLIADMVTSPRLDSNDLELEKGVVCEEIAMYESNPADLCADLFYLVAFPEHKLGKNVLGTRDSVNSMTPDMLRKHMDRFYSPASTVACFCGKFERDKIIALCKHYFSSPANKGVIPVLPKADFCPGVHIFDKKTEQNQIVIGFSAPSLRLPADSLDARRLRVVAALPPPARRTGARLFGRCLRVVISERWRVRREHGCVARIGEKSGSDRGGSPARVPRHRDGRGA